MATKKRPAATQELSRLKQELEQAKARIEEEMRSNASLRSELGGLVRENSYLQSALGSAMSENARIAEHSRRQKRTIEKLKAGLDGLIDASQLESMHLIAHGGGH